jgi:hypothetical protein
MSAGRQFGAAPRLLTSCRAIPLRAASKAERPATPNAGGTGAEIRVTKTGTKHDRDLLIGDRVGDLRLNRPRCREAARSPIEAEPPTPARGTPARPVFQAALPLFSSDVGMRRCDAIMKNFNRPAAISRYTVARLTPCVSQYSFTDKLARSLSGFSRLFLGASIGTILWRGCLWMAHNDPQSYVSLIVVCRYCR